MSIPLVGAHSANPQGVEIGVFDLANVKPFMAGSGIDIPHEYPCAITITDFSLKSVESGEMLPSGRPVRSFLITCRVEEPGFEGATRTITGRAPDLETEKGKNALRNLRTLAESCGYTAAQIEGKQNTFTTAAFVGKRAFIVNKHVVKTVNGQNVRGMYDEADFITPLVYAERHEAIKKNGPAKSPAEGMTRETRSQGGGRLGNSGPASTLGSPGPASTASGPGLGGAGGLGAPQTMQPPAGLGTVDGLRNNLLS